MNIFIVTVIPDQPYVSVKERAAKLESGEWWVTPNTDGKKFTGPCPVNGDPCSDVTGRHHSIPVMVGTVEEAIATFPPGTHITRIEEAGL